MRLYLSIDSIEVDYLQYLRWMLLNGQEKSGGWSSNAIRLIAKVTGITADT